MKRDDWNITDQLLYHLTFTSELISSRQGDLLQSSCGLSLYEWRIMSVISSFKPIASKDIAQVTTMNKVAVSRALARLTDEGLIEKTVSKSDNRVQYLSLTRQGRARFGKARDVFEHWTDSLMSGLRPAEVETLKAALMKLRKRLGEVTDDERARNEDFIFGKRRGNSLRER